MTILIIVGQAHAIVSYLSLNNYAHSSILSHNFKRLLPLLKRYLWRYNTCNPPATTRTKRTLTGTAAVNKNPRRAIAEVLYSIRSLIVTTD